MKLTPIVVLVTDETMAALDHYVDATQSIIWNDAPDVQDALSRVAVNGWTPTMLIAGQLLSEALSHAP